MIAGLTQQDLVDLRLFEEWRMKPKHGPQENELFVNVKALTDAQLATCQALLNHHYRSEAQKDVPNFNYLSHWQKNLRDFRRETMRRAA